jgi:outer membrane immunogenic protein
MTVRGCVATTVVRLVEVRARLSQALLIGILAFGTAGFLAAGPATADGPYSNYKPYDPYNWSGFYIGGQAGFAWGNVNVLDFGPVLDGGSIIDRTSFQPDGVLAGGQVGLQKQFGRWVAGAELSLSGGRLEDSTSISITRTGSLITGDTVVRNEKDTLDTRVGELFLATARLGYTWDRLLAYVKGGYASAEVTSSFHASALATVTHGVALPTGSLTFAGDSSGSSSETHIGYTLGAGLEYMLTRHVVFGVEYDFVSLQDKMYTTNATLTENSFGVPRNITAPITYRVDPDDIHALTARLSYKFGP